MRRFRSGAAAAAALTLAIVLPATGATARPSVARSSTNGWTQLTTTAVSSIDGVDLQSFGRQIEFVWSQTSKNRLLTRIVDTAAHPLAAPKTLLTWASINTYPSIIRAGSTRVISFSGINGATGSEYTAGNQYVLYSTDNGASWHLSTQVLSNDTNAYGSYGSDTAWVGPNTPVQAFTSGSADAVSVHAGFTDYPPATNTDPHGANTGPFAYNTGLGYDSKAHKVWAAWFSNDTKRSHLGVDVQPVYPNFGTALHAPDSYSSYSGSLGTTAIGVTQRIGVAVRSGGGDYVGYSVGYPQGTRVALWRIGSRKPMLLASGGDADGHVDAIAGTKGRVWLVWHDDNQRTIRIARTGTNGSGLAVQCSVATPRGSTDVYDLTGTPVGSDLLLAMNANAGGSSSQLWSKVVKPCTPRHR